MADAGRGGVQQGAKAPAGFQYPYATSPDIIRSNQKDTYFQAILLEHLANILRNLKGARFVHNYTSEAKVFADALYLGLTTLVGNRTLGEEYCDIVQVEAASAQLPALRRRAGYIASYILLPYALTRTLPLLRRRLRALLEANLRRQHAATDATPPGPKDKLPSPSVPTSTLIQQYLLTNLDTITSPAPVYALSLATFYFSGAYYHLSKRLWGLRYIFTRIVGPSEQRAGYEVLGVLLVLQLTVQAYLHLRQTISTAPALDLPPLPANAAAATGTSAVLPGDVEIAVEPSSTSANLLFETPAPAAGEHDASQRRIARTTHTPLLAGGAPRIDLADRRRMRWLAGRQARKCTLCLEPLKDPAATTCGHVFCWSCIAEWLAEKHECPLCRQACLAQHVLPLR